MKKWTLWFAAIVVFGMVLDLIIYVNTRERLSRLESSKPLQHARLSPEIFPQKVESYTYQREPHKGELGIAVYFLIYKPLVSRRLIDAVLLGVRRDGDGNIAGYEVTDVSAQDLRGHEFPGDDDTRAYMPHDLENTHGAFVRIARIQKPFLLRFLLRRQTVPLTTDDMPRELERIEDDCTMIVSAYPKLPEAAK